jgi:Ca2+/Na+ antiporter
MEKKINSKLKNIEEIPEVFEFLRMIPDQDHPAVKTITYFAFFGLLGTLLFMYQLPFVNKVHVWILLALLLLLYATLQWLLVYIEKNKMIDKEKKEKEMNKENNLKEDNKKDK